MIAWLLDKIEADGQAESSHNVALGLTIGSICKIVESRDFDAQRALLLEIFGSNLLLKDKNVVAFSDGKIKSPPETAWSALRAANPKAARAGDLSEFFSNLAGMEGFEPPNARTRTWCLTTWRHPIEHYVFYYREAWTASAGRRAGEMIQ